jgi:hypothetical protein
MGDPSEEPSDTGSQMPPPNAQTEREQNMPHISNRFAPITHQTQVT